MVSRVRLSSVRSTLAAILAVLIVGGSSLVANVAGAEAAPNYNCSCVEYVKAQTGLTGGLGDAANYTESQMKSRGYTRVAPRAGAIAVWDRNQKGALGSGHMAIVTGKPTYNSKTKKWTISFRHVNWAKNCNVHTMTQSRWGDLYGINFYVK